ncbi:MAG: hypothetical protein K0Q70_2811, partial [Rhodospirillales bacterium]|nr:hypothetical protein [Rhodospirillales bacterium]
MTINRSVLGIAALAGLFVIPVGVQAADQRPAQLEGLIRENILVPLPRLDNPPHKLDALLT